MRILLLCLALAWAAPASGRADSTVSPDTLLALAEARVRDGIGELPPGSTLEIGAAYLPSTISVPEGAMRIDVGLGDPSPASLMTPVCRIHIDERLVRSVPIPLRLRLVGPRVRAAHFLARGKALEADDVELAVEEIPLPWSAEVDSRDDVVGLLPRRGIGAGEWLRAELLQEPALVERGEAVVVELESSTVRILTRATAKQSGRMGEWIKVVRDGERRALRARVTGRRRVMISINQHNY